MNRHVGRASRRTNWLWLIVGGLFLISGVGCQEMKKMTGPSIEGNYVLDHRVLPDGKTVRSPDVMGMMTLDDGYRNFNVYWKEDGKPVSISCFSRYWFDGNRYTEESMWYMENLPAASGPKYVTTTEKGSSLVTKSDGKWSFKLPLRGEPDVVFTKDGVTATRAGAFVDHWKKVE